MSNAKSVVDVSELSIGTLVKKYNVDKSYIAKKYFPELSVKTVESYLRPTPNRNMSEETGSRLRACIMQFIANRDNYICKSVFSSISELKFRIYSKKLSKIKIKSFENFEPRFALERGRKDADSYYWSDLTDGIDRWAKTGRIGNHEHTRCIIEARPGMGKSMAMRLIYKRLVEKCSELQAGGDIGRLPVFVALGDLPEKKNYSASNLIDVFLKQHPKFADEDGEEFDAQKYVKSLDPSNLFFVLDGFDEAPLRSRPQLLGCIGGLPSSWVLGTRYVGSFDALNDGVIEVHLQPLTVDQIVNHIDRVDQVLRQDESDDNSDEIARLKILRNELDPDIEGGQLVNDEIKSHESEESNVLSFEVLRSMQAARQGVGQDGGAPKVPGDEPTESQAKFGRVFFPTDPLSRHIQIENKVERSEQPDDEAQRREDLLVLLRTPLVLNLAINTWIDRDHETLSYESIFDHYVRFVIGDWRAARRVASARLTDDVNVAFAAKIFLSIVAHLWLEHLNDTGKQRMPRSSLLKLAQPIIDDVINIGGEHYAADRLLDVAITTGLLIEGEMDSDRYITFSPPGELFAMYLAGLMIQPELIKAEVGDEDSKLLVNKFYYSIYRNSILRDARLRYKEDAVVFWSHIIASNRGQGPLPRQIRNAFEEIRDQPVPGLVGFEEDFDGDVEPYKDILSKIMPVNDILFAKASESSRLLSNMLWPRDARQKMLGELENKYESTNFERIFRAVEPVIREGRRKSLQKNNWRFSYYWDDLFGNYNKTVSSGGKREKAKQARRMVYRIRYHSHNAKIPEVMEMITDYLTSYSKFLSSGNLDSAALLCHDTLKRFKASALSIGVSEQHLRPVDSMLDRLIGPTYDKRLQVQRELEELSLQFANEASYEKCESMLEYVESVDPTILASHGFDPFGAEDFSEEAIVVLMEALIPKLGAFQKETLYTSDQTVCSTIVAKEAISLNFLSAIAREPHCQRHFVCSKYEEMRSQNSSVDKNQRLALLRVLILGAVPGINPEYRPQYFQEMGINASESANHADYSVGGWQLYDYYAFAIWDILHHGERFSFYQA